MNGRTLLITAVLAMAILASRLPYINEAAHRIFRDPDEVELTLMSADRFLGVTSANQHWPGGVQQMLMLPTLIGDFIISSHGNFTADRFADYLTRLYRSPWHALLLAKLVAAVLSSLALAMLYPALRKDAPSEWSAILIVTLLATLPIVWSFCSTAVSGSCAFGLTALALSLLLMAEGRPWVLASGGICIGLAVGCRTVFVPVVPFALALAIRGQGNPWRRVAVFLAASGCGLLIACPYVWNDPIAFGKATLGNFVKHGSPVGIVYALRLLVRAVPVWLCSLVLLGMAVAVRRRQWSLLSGTIVALITMIGPCARAPMVDWRYFLVMPLIATVFAAVTLGPAARDLRWFKHPQIGNWIAVAATTITVLLVIQTSRLERLQSKLAVDAPSSRFAAEAAILRTASAGETVFVPDDVWLDLAEFGSSECYRRDAERSEMAAIGGKSAVAFTSTFGISPELTYMFAENFIEKERSHAARLRAMAGRANSPGLNLVMYSAPEVAARFGASTQEQVLEAFDSPGQKVLLLHGPRPGHSTDQVFGAGDDQLSLFSKK